MDFISALLNSIVGILFSAWTVAKEIWWLFLPFIFFPSLRRTWLTYVQDRYVRSIDWVLLEIKVPKDILKTPKAMEQIFAAMYASYSHGLSFLYLYIDGFVDYWYSFEMAADASGIHFYIMTPAKQRNMVEAAIYAQYPEAEILEVSDYVNELPRKMPNQMYDLWGTDLGFGKPSAYPIRTYPYFEANVEEQRLDPISGLAEIMSGLKEGEHLWWQVIVAPSDGSPYIDNKWVEEGEAVIAKITGEDVKKKSGGFLADVAEWARNVIWAPMELPIWGEAKPEEKKQRQILNPAEQEIVKAISAKIAKLGFETKVRFIYIGKRDGFTNANAVAVMGAERQFNTQDLNQLKPCKEITLLSGWKPRFVPFYKRLMLFSQKKKLFDNYRTRRLGSRRIGKWRPGGKIFTFNTEELATIFHFPLGVVKAPKLRRLDFKSGGPPAELPVE
ncbi:hypothetical protein HY504_02495 [Candidatus Wolfebacteria bacterium]|nr:hypothetical protein [Candidatus Wolfebacteria bacterium]